MLHKGFGGFDTILEHGVSVFSYGILCRVSTRLDDALHGLHFFL